MSTQHPAETTEVELPRTTRSELVYFGNETLAERAGLRWLAIKSMQGRSGNQLEPAQLVAQAFDVVDPFCERFICLQTLLVSVCPQTI